MAGSLAPVIYCIVRSTLCSALRSEAKQLPYQAVMQPVSQDALNGAALESFEDLPNLFSLLRDKKVLSCPLHNCLGVLGPC